MNSNYYESYTNDLPEKFKLLRQFVKFHSLENKFVLDIGGSANYYESLIDVLEGSYVYLLNANSQDVEGIANSICGDASKLPFKNETWDMVLSFDTIEHLNNPDSFLSEAFRILKVGGLFVISTPNLSDFYSRITFLFGYTPFNYTPSKFRVAVPLSKLDTSMGHISVFTYKGLDQLLLIHGLYVLKRGGYFYCDDFHINKNPLSERGVGLYNTRKLINNLLPVSMREGMIFLCMKKIAIGEKTIR